MECWFTMELSGDAQEGIREVIGAEVNDVPVVVVSVGYVFGDDTG